VISQGFCLCCSGLQRRAILVIRSYIIASFLVTTELFDLFYILLPVNLILIIIFIFILTGSFEIFRICYYFRTFRVSAVSAESSVLLGKVSMSIPSSRTGFSIRVCSINSSSSVRDNCKSLIACCNCGVMISCWLIFICIFICIAMNPRYPNFTFERSIFKRYFLWMLLICLLIVSLQIEVKVKPTSRKTCRGKLFVPDHFRPIHPEYRQPATLLRS